MPSGQYSYIDIASLDAIRGRFAAGDAVAILTLTLDEVIWANGPGAALFGYSEIGSAIGKEPQIGLPAKRQIMATSGYPQIGKDRSITIRLSSGMTSRAVSFVASEIALPGGEDAILLVAPAASGAWRSPAETAGRAIAGLDQAGQHAAIIDVEGQVIASSSAFEGLGIGPDTLSSLVAESRGERLVKRMIEAGTAYLPAGFVRLTDEPATHLLVVVDDAPEDEAETAPLAAAGVVDSDMQVGQEAAASHDAADQISGDDTAKPVEGLGQPGASTGVEADQGSSGAPLTVSLVGLGTSPPLREGEQPKLDGRQPPGSGSSPPQGGGEAPSEAKRSEGDTPIPTEDAEASHRDSWYFAGPDAGDEVLENEAAELNIPAPATSETVEAATEEPATPLLAVVDDEAETAPSAPAEAANSDMQVAREATASHDAADQISGEDTAEPVEGLGQSGTSTDVEAEQGSSVAPLSVSPVGLNTSPPLRGGEEPKLDVPEPVSTREASEATAGTSETIAEPPARIAIDRSAAPVRFVWKTDAEGRFSEISEEFAATVGQEAADIVGVSFGDAAQKLGIDPTGEIAGLLERRDTWSGRSVLWPVAGTDLSIPVDLAALPSYGRDRQFAGFRGFGVARAGDAIVDPDARGFALVGETVNEIFATDDLASATRAEAPQEIAAAQNDPAPQEDTSPPRNGDPFQGEVPALSIVAKQDRRHSDKVIQLAQHRSPTGEKALSPGERNAFREIGDRLRKDSTPVSKPPAEPQLRADNDHGHIPHTQEPAAAEADSTQPIEADTTADNLQAAAETIGKLLASSEGDRPVETAEAAAEHVELAGGEMEKPSPGAGDASIEAGSEAGPAAAEIRATGEQAELPASTTGEVATESVTPSPGPSPQGGGEPGGSATQRHTLTALDEAEASATPPPSPSWAGSTNARGFMPSAFASGPASSQRGATDTTILEQLPVPVLIHSGDALHYANREFLELTGYDSVAELQEAGGLGALFGEPYANEDDSAEPGRKLRLRTGEGLEYPVEAFLQSVPWGEGKALLLSLRRSWRQPVSYPAVPANAAQAPVDPDFEERIAEMRAIVDTATDGVVLISRDGSIRSISSPAEALFGFDSAEVLGKPFTSLFAIESQRAARDYLNGLSENGVASVLNDGREVIGRESQGRFIPLFMTIGKLPNDSGFCAVVRDITQWKRAEEELTQARAQAERASSQKTEFLARVSHEIRTPLNAIIGFSELMLDEKFGPITNDRYRDYLRDINRSGNHVLDLVNDLLDISKIEAGQQEMSYEAVSLNDTLAETVAMMQPQANRERVIIRSSFASRLPEVVADLRSVRQIALNLMSNAIRYTPAGGQVIVSTAYEASGDVVMRVRDTGIGMSQAEIEQALKPFKQINALKRARGDGTGLGLPLTKAMVEANRARFMINSTPGEGTLVEITFPSTRVLAD